MKSIQYLLSSLAAATAYVLVTNARNAAPSPVEEPAQKLQHAWADYRTIV
jgi:hypothetical protein